MTRSKIIAFVKRRNESPFNTNLQFNFDLSACGLTLDDLGKATRGDGDWEGAWIWDTPLGRLVEYAGKLQFHDAESVASES
jgi:hypothetical protein